LSARFFKIATAEAPDRSKSSRLIILPAYYSLFLYLLPYFLHLNVRATNHIAASNNYFPTNINQYEIAITVSNCPA